ncbi:MAG: hypothetical protein WD079_00840 [Phycisphaeraceae bacterium]
MNLLNNLWSWWSGQAWPIAVDVGAMSVRTLQLGGTGASWRVAAAGRYDLPDSARTTDNQPFPHLHEALTRLLDAGAYQGDAAVVVLPHALTRCEMVTLDIPAEATTEQALQAAAHTAFSPERDHIQYSPMGGEVEQFGVDRTIDAMLLAVDREVVQELVSILHELDLEPAAIEPAPLALARCTARFARRERDQRLLQVVLDAGHAGTRVMLMQGRAIVDYACIDRGAGAIDGEAAATLDVDTRTVRTARLAHWHQPKNGDDDDLPRRAFAAADVPLRELATQVDQVLRTFVQRHGCELPGRLRITGGSAYDRQLVDHLAQQIGVEVSPAEPLHAVDVSNPTLMIERRGTQPEWATVMGAALRSMAAENVRDAA